MQVSPQSPHLSARASPLESYAWELPPRSLDARAKVPAAGPQGPVHERWFSASSRRNVMGREGMQAATRQRLYVMAQGTFLRTTCSVGDGLTTCAEPKASEPPRERIRPPGSRMLPTHPPFAAQSDPRLRLARLPVGRRETSSEPTGAGSGDLAGQSVV